MTTDDDDDDDDDGNDSGAAVMVLMTTDGDIGVSDGVILMISMYSGDSGCDVLTNNPHNDV